MLQNTINDLKAAKVLPWLGIAYLNQGLAYLANRQAQEAISATLEACQVLKTIQSWRVSEVYHLLARCYLAVGKLKEAQTKIEEAKTLSRSRN